MEFQIKCPYCGWVNFVAIDGFGSEVPTCYCCHNEDCNQYFAYYIAIEPTIVVYELQSTNDSCPGCQANSPMGPHHRYECSQHCPF
jgi:hypothetical protein